jgi:ABC-type multidrug transport system fused ATPase/permease subunit
LQRIRQNYIRSGWFFINLLACIPGTLISELKFDKYNKTHSEQISEEQMDDAVKSRASLFFLLELFKLCRLARFKKLINQSQFISRLWETINVETALAMKFMFLIALISHWIACLWGLIAFIEAGSYSADQMTGTVNWIGNWYGGSYVEGGLNPIGWQNYMDRYWLCLFWAIQSITSIGYGNIAPVTKAEVRTWLFEWHFIFTRLMLTLGFISIHTSIVCVCQLSHAGLW